MKGLKKENTAYKQRLYVQSQFTKLRFTNLTFTPMRQFRVFKQTNIHGFAEIGTPKLRTARINVLAAIALLPKLEQLSSKHTAHHFCVFQDRGLFGGHFQVKQLMCSCSR